MRNVYPLIYQGWDDYEQKKKENGHDPSLFSCNDVWELFYLEKKIQQSLPHIDRMVIFEIIGLCCQSKPTTIPRIQFIDTILRSLMIIDKFDESSIKKS